MTRVKNPPTDAGKAYKLAAAEFRAKLVADKRPIEGEVLPSDGAIRAVLSGKPIPLDRLEALFGPGAIDLPEFRLTRKPSS